MTDKYQNIYPQFCLIQATQSLKIQQQYKTLTRLLSDGSLVPTFPMNVSSTFTDDGLSCSMIVPSTTFPFPTTPVPAKGFGEEVDISTVTSNEQVCNFLLNDEEISSQHALTHEYWPDPNVDVLDYNGADVFDFDFGFDVAGGNDEGGDAHGVQDVCTVSTDDDAPDVDDEDKVDDGVDAAVVIESSGEVID